ncbi:MAG: type II toxin-antitoxin system RelE/ParE family toxin [Oscillospiraceae bacterium]|nr:type II toxin-antitoxin system RelE/ParE family toxin [Oscillospiraceae bacterium]
MNNIQYSHESLIDLNDIKKHISEELDSPVAAKNTIEKITRKIRKLEDFPEMGAPLSSIVDIETDYRFLVCNNYLVFYRVDKTEVLIIRVVYGGRDYLSLLFREQSKDDEENGDKL